jgi:hypothetical protein
MCFMVTDYEFVIVLFKNKMVDTKWRTFILIEYLLFKIKLVRYCYDLNFAANRNF